MKKNTHSKNKKITGFLKERNEINLEINGLTHEELEQLSDIDGYGKWQKIERYYPETRYVPDTGSKLKTGVIALPPRKQKPVSPLRRLYLIIDEDGKKLLMKTDDISLFNREGEIADFANRAFTEQGVYVSYPLEVGPYADETRVYSMYNFLTGDNLARTLPTLYVPQQHELGIEAGKLLKKFHALATLGNEVRRKPVDDIFLLLTKLEEKETQYQGFREASSFMKKHFDITSGRPLNALHGDFSANTLFIDKGLNVGMFPLEDPHWGDPIKDLISLQESYSMPFIKGVFKGIFDGAPPADFFELLTYYSTERALSDINMADNDEDKATAILRAQKLAAELDNYQTVIPSWY